MTTILIGLWLALLFSIGIGGCSTEPRYWSTAYLAITVCIVLWVNHLAIAPVQRARDVLRLVGFAIYDLFSLSVLVVLASIPFSVLQTECYTPRNKVAELMLSGSSYRTQMDERFESQKTLENIGKGIQVELTQRVRSGMVTSDGTIVLASEDPVAVVFLTPHVEQGKLIWKCSGLPKSVLPMPCREN
ncbi:hypothetical protein [Rhodoferax sp. GW822-FHT02A01]|uniref:pilin n=1 Tax=Rhodoferax sp. GW822-FHT02A01 TaxID=3141537 RepID=UPI00315C4BEA